MENNLRDETPSILLSANGGAVHDLLKLVEGAQTKGISKKVTLTPPPCLPSRQQVGHPSPRKWAYFYQPIPTFLATLRLLKDYLMEFGKRIQTPKAGSSANIGFENDVQHKTIIIGNGLSGRETAKAILKQKNNTAVTVIESKNFYESDITTPFALRKPELYEKVRRSEASVKASRKSKEKRVRSVEFGPRVTSASR